MTGESPITAEQLERLPFFPLPGTVFFPHSLLPLHIFEPRYREMTAWCLENHYPLAVARILPGHESEHLGDPPVIPVCGVGHLRYHKRLPDGRYIVFLQGVGRVRIVEEHPRAESFRMARVKMLQDRFPESPEVLGKLVQDLKSCLATLIIRWPTASKMFDPVLGKTDDPVVLSDTLAAILIQDSDVRQQLLECLDVHRRLERVRDGIIELLTQSAPEEGPVQ